MRTYLQVCRDLAFGVDPGGSRKDAHFVAATLVPRSSASSRGRTTKPYC
ncbi:hypothetical protein ACFV1F_45175 [Streptomyces sp. NPDC059590]